MEDINVKVLDEVNKGATMGMDAINYLVPKVKDGKFKGVLDIEYNKYKDISRRANNLYENYSSKEPHETNAMNKAMTWYGIEMKTLMDTSTSKLAELLLQGTNMGIIEGRKLLNHKSTDENVHALVQEYIDMQEQAVEKLKTFL
mgnify:CR=1 FL=1